MEVWKYDHNSSSKHYKDCQMAKNSWREISRNIGLDVAEYRKRWKNLRDKYARHRKKLGSRSGDPGGKKVPAFYVFMSWLAPHDYESKVNICSYVLIRSLCFGELTKLAS